MTPQSLNSNTYTIAVDATSKSATILDNEITVNNVLFYNDSTNAVYVVSGLSSAPTAVFPTSATVPVMGKVIAPKSTQVFTKPDNHKYISAIQASAGTGNLFFSVGAGV